jgi:hypothetical protein
MSSHRDRPDPELGRYVTPLSQGNRAEISFARLQGPQVVSPRTRTPQPFCKAGVDEGLVRRWRERGGYRRERRRQRYVTLAVVALVVAGIICLGLIVH